MDDPQAYDMMKRSMDPTGGPDSKKARWSPSEDAFANYGYGPQAQLYSTPSLSINTQANGVPPPQMSPGQPSPVNGYPGYNMMPMMGMFPYNTGFQRLPSLQIPNASAQAGQPSPYSPALLSAAAALTSSNAAQAGGAINRTVYIGNLPPTASVDELLNLVHFGPLENIRVLPEKSCVFLSFMDAPTAAAFHADATIKKLTLHGHELKIGWGKPSAVPAQVLQAISQSGASRNVYLGGLEEGMSEEQLRDDLSRFGLIDQVKIVRDKNIGFVHFLSISTATKVVNALPLEPSWAGKRVNYGKDRCAYIPKSQQAAAQQAQAAAAQSLVAQSAAAAAFNQLQGMGSPQSAALGGSFNIPMNGQQTPQTPSLSGSFPLNGQSGMSADQIQQAMAAASTLVSAAAASPMIPSSPFPMTPIMGSNPMLGGMGVGMGNGGLNLNRTVYLGNIHPETSVEDLCNAIRGGVLQSIRYMADKHIAFVTFIDPTAALTFFHASSFTSPLTINNRRLKIGWGKPSGPLPPQLALAVHGGATRNVYIGNIPGEELGEGGVMNEEKLRRDFGEWGEVELVNFLREKNCAFVNFTNISNAIKAIEGIKSKPEYANLRIAHGKDRCANPPRSGAQGGMGGGRRSSNAHSNVHTNGLNGNGVEGIEEGVLEEYGDGGESQGEMHVDQQLGA